MKKTENSNLSPEIHDLALVVDDDPEICELVATALTRVGFQVDTTTDPVRALEMFPQKNYAVVLTDWKMPGMDGINLITRIKSTHPQIGAVLMTGYGTEETIVDAFTRGKINYYISKPFELSDLLETVSAAAREHKLNISREAFKLRLEQEISQATKALEQKNALLEEKNKETEQLNRELRIHQNEIQSTKEYLENIIESSADAIISTDQDLNINLFSRGAEEMFHLDSSQYQGRAFESILKNGRSEIIKILGQLENRTRTTSIEAEAVRADGEILFLDLSVSRLHGKPADQGYLFVMKNISERKRLEEELKASNIVLERLSVTDPLTNLFNRRHFQENLEREFERAERFRTPLAMIILDLDDFKLVNDTHGHQVGDLVLIEAAELIRRCIRTVDLPARYGGEEFTIILPQTDLANAIQVAERIKESFEHFSRNQTIAPGQSITASLGVAVFPESGASTPDDLIRFADQALYRAKQIGKNRIVVGESDGLKAIGGGERLSQTEKNAILRKLGQKLRTTLNLDSVLETTLNEMISALGEQPEEFPCSIMLMNDRRRLRTEIEMNSDKKRRREFKAAAQKVVKDSATQTLRGGEDRDPVSSFPIIISNPGGLEEVVGVINIGVIPIDLDFFQDLVNQAAMAINNAKIYREMEQAKSGLEGKVNELTHLSLMGITLQRNAQLLNDFEDENYRLITRCLSEVGFEKVMYLDYDRDSETLVGRADNSLRGKMKPVKIDLSKLSADSRLKKAVNRQEDFTKVPVIVIDPGKKGDVEDVEALKALSAGSPAALAPLFHGSRIKGFIIAAKKSITSDDEETLALFVLHAGLTIENLDLSANFKDKSNRLSLLYDTSMKLSTPVPAAQRESQFREILQGLIKVLKASEISFYSYSDEQKIFTLLSYTSSTAAQDHMPALEIELGTSKVMSLTVNSFLKTGEVNPLIITDLKKILGGKSRKRYSSNSYMGVPLVVGGQLQGVLNVTDKDDKSGFNSEDAALARTTSGMLASLLYNIFLFDRIEHQAFDTFSIMLDEAESKGEKDLSGHSRRVALLATSMCQAMGLPKNETETIQRAARLHDLGKVINAGKKGKTDQDHPRLGKSILGDWLKDLHPGVHWHHEQADGHGYPDGLAGGSIPLMAQVISVSDSFDRSIKDNPHKKVEEIISSVIDKTGEFFDEKVVQGLVKGIFSNSEIRESYGMNPAEGLKDSLIENLSEKKGKTKNEYMRDRFLSFIRETGTE